MRWLLLVLLLGSVTACDGDTTAGTQGAQAVPTRVASSATPIAASQDSAVASANLRAASAKTGDARSYRSAFSLTITVANGAAAKTDPFLVYEASAEGDNSQIVYTGGTFNEILGGGARIEVINADHRTFIRGAAMFGATEPDKWYVFPDSRMTDLPLDAGDILQIIDEDFGGARAAAVVSLDAQTCTLWISEFQATAGNLLEWLIGRGTSGEPHTVESAEARYTVCRDGYIHQFEWDVTARSADTPGERTTLTVRSRQSDFGAADIGIKAPQGAIEIR